MFYRVAGIFDSYILQEKTQKKPQNHQTLNLQQVLNQKHKKLFTDQPS